MTAIELEPFELDLAEPLVTADGTIDHRRGLLVRAGCGIGEATPLAPWTEPYDETERRLTDLVEADLPPHRALTSLADAPAARHGLASALLDHHARTRDVPLYRHLGGALEVDAVPVNATIDADSPAGVAEAGTAAVADGFEAVKLKVGRHAPTDDIDRAAALREAVGEATVLRLDANGAWEHQTVCAIADDLAALDLDYLEDPSAGFEPARIAELAAAGVPVAVDEPLATTGVAAVAKSAAVAVVIKPMALGGPDRARATARTARTLGLVPVISDLVTGAVGRTAAAHVAASLGDPAPAGLATGGRLATDLVAEVPVVSAGRFHLPDGTGLGLPEGSVHA